ncbi:hypothetical protein ACWCQK_41195 [Streptomyces sp. NPDC002306]
MAIRAGSAASHCHLPGPSIGSPKERPSSRTATALAIADDLLLVIAIFGGLIERLPPGRGLAYVGNAEELAAYERKADTTESKSR